jgi:hypothetical protein
MHCSFHLDNEGANRIVAGGGIWHPEADPLATLRRAVDRAPKKFKDVLRDEGIRREFLDNAGKTDAQVVKAFVKANAENALKTKPKVSHNNFLFNQLRFVNGLLSHACIESCRRGMPRGGCLDSTADKEARDQLRGSTSRKHPLVPSLVPGSSSFAIWNNTRDTRSLRLRTGPKYAVPQQCTSLVLAGEDAFALTCVKYRMADSGLAGGLTTPNLHWSHLPEETQVRYTLVSDCSLFHYEIVAARSSADSERPAQKPPCYVLRRKRTDNSWDWRSDETLRNLLCLFRR